MFPWLYASAVREPIFLAATALQQAWEGLTLGSKQHQKNRPELDPQIL